MIRERQKVRDVQGYNRDGIIQFSPEGESVSVLGYHETKEVVTVPGRREGQEHIGEQIIRRLGVTATYESIDQLVSDASLSQRLYWLDRSDKTWTIDEMPDEVRSEYLDWRRSLSLDESGFRQALHDVAQQPTDRMIEKVDCPHCPDDPKYACYLSGQSRQLYKYPMARMVNDSGDKIYQVPLDAALLVEHHPDALTYGIQSEFSNAGIMSARFIIELDINKISGDYVKVATNGAVSIEEDLTLLSSGHFRIVVADWFEHHGRRTHFSTDSAKLAEELQKIIVVDNADRVTDRDYNKMLDRARCYLGKFGLNLAFRTSINDWGDKSISFMAINDKGEISASQVGGGEDAYSSLEIMDEKIRRGIPLAPYF